MKTRWEIKKLGEMSEIEKKRNSHKDIPFIGLEDIESNTSTFLGSKEPRKVKSSSFYFNQEHILYGRLRPYLNKVLLPDFEGHCSTEIFPIKTKPLLNKKFLFYWVTSDEIVQKINGTCTGTRMPRANMKEVMDFDIPCPPLLEQQNIVAILDEVFAAIDKAKLNAEKNLENSREVFASYLKFIFTKPGDEWAEKKLGEILKLEYGKPLPDSQRKPNGAYPVYGANGEKDRTDEHYHDQKSIIVGRKGSAGEINLTEKIFWPLDVTYFVVIDDKHYDLYFVYYLLRNLDLTKLAKGVKPGINRNEVYSINVRIPILPEQRFIVSKLDALSAETKKLESIYVKKLADLAEMKKSILQKAFNGELTEA
jgi:type I restriction enzyme S subunit